MRVEDVGFRASGLWIGVQCSGVGEAEGAEGAEGVQRAQRAQRAEGAEGAKRAEGAEVWGPEGLPNGYFLILGFRVQDSGLTV